MLSYIFNVFILATSIHL